jgi:hypothetical protein
MQVKRTEMKKRIFPQFYILLITVLLASSCAKKDIKSNEDFKIIPGKAKIVSIVPSSDSSEPGMVHVYFDFISKKSAGDYKYPRIPDKNIKLYQDHRENFHRNWIKKWNIKEGNFYSALRYERVNSSSKINNVYFEILFDKGPQ